MCCVEYSLCSDSVDNFSLDNRVDNTMAANQKAVVGTDCFKAMTASTDTATTNDYIVIDGKFQISIMS